MSGEHLSSLFHSDLLLAPPSLRARLHWRFLLRVCSLPFLLHLLRFCFCFLYRLPLHSICLLVTRLHVLLLRSSLLHLIPFVIQHCRTLACVPAFVCIILSRIPCFSSLKLLLLLIPMPILFSYRSSFGGSRRMLLLLLLNATELWLALTCVRW